MSGTSNSGAIIIVTDEYIERIIPSKYILSTKENSLLDNPLKIGRAMTSNMIVDSQMTHVSRDHAHIVMRIEDGSSSYYLYDQDSRNGTYVNNEMINGPYLLQNSDYIGLGLANHPMLRFICSTLAPTITTSTEDNKKDRIWLDSRTQQFWIDNTPLDLSKNELLFMQYLYHNVGKLCNRADCARAIWGQTFDNDTALYDHALNQLVSSLRKDKLSQNSFDSEETKFICTIRGTGFILNNNPVKK